MKNLGIVMKWICQSTFWNQTWYFHYSSKLILSHLIRLEEKDRHDTFWSY